MVVSWSVQNSFLSLPWHTEFWVRQKCWQPLTIYVDTISGGGKRTLSFFLNFNGYLITIWSSRGRQSPWQMTSMHQLTSWKNYEPGSVAIWRTCSVWSGEGFASAGMVIPKFEATVPTTLATTWKCGACYSRNLASIEHKQGPGFCCISPASHPLAEALQGQTV